MKGRRCTLLVAAPIALVGLLLSCNAGVAWSVTNWTVMLHAVSSGEARSQTIPSGPTGVTASCNAPTLSRTIKVTWSAVTHATTYTVYDSTTSATGTYSAIATGVTSASWTSGTLTAGTNYWFEVTASIGSNWTSTKSSTSVESTINTFSPYCVQP